MVTITGCITLQPTKEIMDTLSYPNPFEPDKVFEAFQINSDGTISIPRAYPVDLSKVSLQVSSSIAIIEVASSYNLREYQKEAVAGIVKYFDGLDYGQCLLSAPCGSGKSYALAGILSSLGYRVLILSHLTLLGTQIADELGANLEAGTIKILDSKSVGEPLADINICSFQLLDSSKELLDYLSDKIGLVVVDEAENAVTNSRLQVLFGLAPRYFLYLTATPSRELMQQTSAVRYLFGDKAFLMDQPEESKVHSKHVMLDYRHLEWYAPMNKQMYKKSLGTFLLKSRIFNDIVDIVSSFKELPGCVWIVVDLGIVKDKLKFSLENHGNSVEIIDASTSQKKRAEILANIRNGTVDCILGSKPLSAGLSIKELLVGIRLMPSSSSAEELQQSTGRLNRDCEFKKYLTPLWIDFVCSGSLMYGAKIRYKKYKESTLGVVFCKPDLASSKAMELITEKSFRLP